jgi:hypothetical protein
LLLFNFDIVKRIVYRHRRLDHTLSSQERHVKIC